MRYTHVRTRILLLAALFLVHVCSSKPQSKPQGWREVLHDFVSGPAPAPAPAPPLPSRALQLQTASQEVEWRSRVGRMNGVLLAVFDTGTSIKQVTQMGKALGGAYEYCWRHYPDVLRHTVWLQGQNGTHFAAVHRLVRPAALLWYAPRSLVPIEYLGVVHAEPLAHWLQLRHTAPPSEAAVLHPAVRLLHGIGGLHHQASPPTDPHALLPEGVQELARTLGLTRADTVAVFGHSVAPLGMQLASQGLRVLGTELDPAAYAAARHTLRRAFTVMHGGGSAGTQARA